MSQASNKQTPKLTKIMFKQVVELDAGEVYAVFSDGVSECFISLDNLRALKEELTAAERAIALRYQAIALSKNGNLF